MAPQPTFLRAAASTDAALAARLLAAAAFLPILSAAVASGVPTALALATVLVIAIAAFAASGTPGGRSALTRRRATAAIVLFAGALLIAWRGAAWADEVLHQPHDPYRADMLIVIQQAIRRLLDGRNPYGMYRVPWEAPLPYGPALWAPFVAPALLRIDIRIVTLAGELLLPVLVVLFAWRAARGGRLTVAVAALAVAAAWLFNPDVGRFSVIGHTPAYWPWIPVLAFLVAGEQWIAAACVLGILCVARTTMIAIVPVFVIAMWLRARSRLTPAAAAFAAPIVLLFGPFAASNWSTLAYGLVGSYERVMKGFVWTSTQWVQGSVGITGFLLRAGLSREVEIVQIVALLLAYAFAWRALRKPSADSSTTATGWMALALCVFSATTLWPVAYIYFDVVLLMTSALLARDHEGRRSLRPAVVVLALMATIGVLIAGMRLAAPADVAIDVGSDGARRLLTSGFSNNEREGATTFAWVEGREATIVVPRFSRSAARVTVRVRPAAIAGAPPQQMTAAIGETTIGTATLQPGWQEVSFDAPARALTAGANVLTLYFAQTVSPREAGTGDDARRLAVAIDEVRVYSSARLVPSS